MTRRLPLTIALTCAGIAAMPAAATTYVQYQVGVAGQVLDFDPSFYLITHVPRVSYFIGTLSVSFAYDTPSADSLFVSPGYGAYATVTYGAGSSSLSYTTFSASGDLTTLSVGLPGTTQGDATDFEQITGSGYSMQAGHHNYTQVTETATGITTLFSATPFAGPAIQQTLTAVPEPASWALMLAGFGVIGGVMRRRPAVRLRFA